MYVHVLYAMIVYICISHIAEMFFSHLARDSTEDHSAQRIILFSDVSES